MTLYKLGVTCDVEVDKYILSAQVLVSEGICESLIITLYTCENIYIQPSHAVCVCACVFFFCCNTYVF